MDTTGDKYVLRYLGKTLTAVPTRLASVQLPRLELLPPRELAALLSSDEVLAEVRSALADALWSLPQGLARDPELAARWVDERLAGNLGAAVHRLRHSVRQLPDAAKIGSAAGGIGATVLAGVLTASPAQPSPSVSAPPRPRPTSRQPGCTSGTSTTSSSRPCGC